MTLDRDLLDILVCPSCHGPLEERQDPHSLVCLECGLIYPVRDGIPIMLIEEAYREEDS